MKKLISVLLVFACIFSLVGCNSSDTPASSEENSKTTSTVSSSTPSDTTTQTESEIQEEELSQGIPIEYPSVAQGYISHLSLWAQEINEYEDYECMGEGSFLYVPEQTILMSNSKYGLYIYSVSSEYLVLDTDRMTKMGVNVYSTCQVKDNNSTYTFDKPAIIRLSVQGKLQDVQIYVPKELESEIRFGTVEDFTK